MWGVFVVILVEKHFSICSSSDIVNGYTIFGRTRRASLLSTHFRLTRREVQRVRPHFIKRIFHDLKTTSECVKTNWEIV